MAPVGLDLIGESISRSSEGPAECVSCATVCAGGSFFVGFSSGFALLVASKKNLPTRASSILAFPTVVGLSAALMVHKYQIKQCERVFYSSPYFKRANTVNAVENTDTMSLS